MMTTVFAAAARVAPSPLIFTIPREMIRVDHATGAGCARLSLRHEADLNLAIWQRVNAPEVGKS